MSKWHAGVKVGIYGALPGSLGANIKKSLPDADVTTLGPSHPFGNYHDVEFDVTDSGEDHLEKFDNVVVTIGINLPDEEDYLGMRQMTVNYFGVIKMADRWAGLRKPGQFVVIGSNSAHIARSSSIGYCASKAALSMGIRCLARREAARIPDERGFDEVGIFYAWEFGLLMGTPMTADVALRVGPDAPLTRMPGLADGIPAEVAAHHVANTLRYGWRELNGTTLRLDGGEQ